MFVLFGGPKDEQTSADINVLRARASN